MPARLRFAPSPNGLLHAGHAFSALVNEAVARRLGGELLLRLEDIDTTRCRPELATAMLEDLAWLGVAFTGEVVRQSQRFDLYGAALNRLGADGLLYEAPASRTRIAAAVAASGTEPWPRDPDGAVIYPGAVLPRAPWRPDSTGVPVRLDMSRAMAGLPQLDWQEAGRGTIPADPAAWGDVILARKEFAASYHLSVVVDDAAQGITHVVRGEDLFAATGLHRLLQHRLGLPAPHLYLHHGLIRDAGGDKLSKSLGSTSLRDLRQGGMTAPALRDRLQADILREVARL